MNQTRVVPPFLAAAFAAGLLAGCGIRDARTDVLP
jgi:hypothetical protein